MKMLREINHSRLLNYLKWGMCSNFFTLTDDHSQRLEGAEIGKRGGREKERRRERGLSRDQGKVNKLKFYITLNIFVLLLYQNKKN